MDTSLLASHCIELLRTHNRVSLGNMGSFVAENTPATLTHGSHVLLPPGRRISFKESETWNDGLLEKAYGNKKELHTLLQGISKKLAKEKSVTLEDFGKLRRTKEGDVFFVMDKNVSVSPNGFGLVPLSMSPLPVPSKVQCATPVSLEETSVKEAEVTDSDSSGTAKKIQHPVHRENGRKGKGLIIFLIVVLLLILALFLVYVFRDSLTSFGTCAVFSAGAAAA